ncbi:hypothetical protein D3C73_1158780 [compost metagenome]
MHALFLHGVEVLATGEVRVEVRRQHLGVVVDLLAREDAVSVVQLGWVGFGVVLDDAVHESTDKPIVVLGNVVQVTGVDDNGPFQWGQADDEFHDLLEMVSISPVQVGGTLDARRGLLDIRVHEPAFVHATLEFVVGLALDERQHVR